MSKVNIDAITTNATNASRGLARHREYLEQIKQSPHLKVLSGPMKGAEIFVQTSPFRVGRGPNNQFVLADGAVEGFHVLIQRNPVGSYTLTALEPDLAPVFVRKWGRYRKVSYTILRDGMIFRLARLGPRIKFRYLGDEANASRFSRVLAADPELEDLLPDQQVRLRLEQMVVTSRLQDSERHYIRQASFHLRVLSKYRRWIVFLSVLGMMVSGILIYFKLNFDFQRLETRNARDQLATRWLSQAQAAEQVNQPAEQKSEDEKADMLLANDRTAKGVVNIIRTFGVENPYVNYQFVSLIKNEVDREKERLLRDSDLEGFLERYRRYHARVEDIFRKEYQLPSALAYVAWVESDYFVDMETEKGGLGMWQFNVATATTYELITPKGEDFRQDFERSTRAAARYLSDLLGQWGNDGFMIALAAYSWGPDNALDLFKKYRLWSTGQRAFPYIINLKGERGVPAVPEDIQRYVPRFFAANLIGSDIAFYLGRPDPKGETSSK